MDSDLERNSMSEELQRYEPQEPESNAVVPYHPLPPPSLFGTADPVEVVARATRVAAALKEVIKAQGLISKISGKEYPRCEAWTLLGTMLGVFPVLSWSRAVEGGWEARVEARTRDGSVVGAAEAQCLKTERNWSNRDDFALRSMAQTRATAKALRMPLGFVMTLGGFQPTPAEEMDFEQSKPQQQAKTSSRGTSSVPHSKSPPATPKPAGAASPSATPALATEKTRAWFLAEMRKRFKDATLLMYGMDFGPPYALMPQESLEDWALGCVPTSKLGLTATIQSCELFTGVAAMDGPRQDETTQRPAESSQDAAADSQANDLELGQSGLEDPQEPAPDDGVETMLGVLEQISEKSGTSAKGKWTRFGLCVGGRWFSTFNATLAKAAASDKNHSVRVYYKHGEKGDDLVGIERAKKD